MAEGSAGPLRVLAEPAVVHQTDFTPGTGNSLQAAVASMLGLPLDQVPNFVALDCGYEAGIRGFAAERGLAMRKVPPAELRSDTDAGRLCIIRGKSPRGAHGHVVVGKVSFTPEVKYEHLHDPHPDGTFLDPAEAVGWVMFLD
eukprot:TRINITY_DN14240_c0_g1_i1.p1 TRINITY_DN14240_c0_g1~~TRINITY_DN14240_c0_g1_i1.p1  ORF type:complete len:168 (+),score=58.16 TRINITY_DN14240_c0_g1_i1:78-506(+)